MKNLDFHRDAYTVSPRGTRVYYALSYLPPEGRDYDGYSPTGAYHIERLGASMWVVTARSGMTNTEQLANIRHLGSFKTHTVAKQIANNDYHRQQFRRSA